MPPNYLTLSGFPLLLGNNLNSLPRPSSLTEPRLLAQPHLPPSLNTRPFCRGHPGLLSISWTVPIPTAWNELSSSFTRLGLSHPSDHRSNVSSPGTSSLCCPMPRGPRSVILITPLTPPQHGPQSITIFPVEQLSIVCLHHQNEWKFQGSGDLTYLIQCSIPRAQHAERAPDHRFCPCASWMGSMPRTSNSHLHH